MNRDPRSGLFRRFIALGLSVILGTSWTLSFAPSAQAVLRDFYSVTNLNGATVVLGDTLKIQSEFCWSSMRNDPKYPTRLEIKSGNKWIPVGASTLAKNGSVCSKSSFPYLKTFTWTPTSLGTFEIRNREKSPALKAKFTVVASIASSGDSNASSQSGSSNSGSGISRTKGLDKANCSFNGQRLYGSVYITDREIFSDFTVYVTDREIFSDLSVFKTDRELFANKCGLWYITDREIFSDFTIYVTDREIFSDLTIFLTDREIFAGIN
jgi:hypothetical protein